MIKKYLSLVAMSIVMISTTLSSAQDSTFTYQGELTINGSPVNDVYSMEFALFNQLNGGDSFGTIAEVVTVANGRFAVNLDYGPTVYLSAPLFLQITVDGVTLSPRTALTNTPMAIHTRGIAVNSSEEVGLGTTNPTARLDVVSDSSSNGNNTARFFAPEIGPNVSHVHFGQEGDWFIRSASDDGKVVIQDNDGGVAIGTDFANPDYKTTISPVINDGAINAVGNTTTMPIINAFNLGTGPTIWATGINDTSLSGGGLLVVGIQTAQNISIDGNEIMARDAGGPSTLLLNREGGDVFVGSASGGTSTLRTPVLQITGGSDLSELFDVNGDAKVEPGMVVVIDETQPGKLIPSTNSYDRKVAGIISGAGDVATGMTMGQKGTIADGEYPVALSGRVYCLVDATYSGITPGDLLTTSQTLGHAMKADNMELAQGAVIGKAMTALPKGEKGLVLVLVNLQ